MHRHRIGDFGYRISDLKDLSSTDGFTVAGNRQKTEAFDCGFGTADWGLKKWDEPIAVFLIHFNPKSRIPNPKSNQSISV